MEGANTSEGAESSNHALPSRKARKQLTEPALVKQRILRDDSNMFEESNTMVVSTQIDGYNSGRQYRFQTVSQDACVRLVAQLRRLVVEARKREAGKTRFRKSRESLGRVINSMPFQTMLTLIILAVSSGSLTKSPAS